jgi:hypothetical protein
LSYARSSRLYLLVLGIGGLGLLTGLVLALAAERVGTAGMLAPVALAAAPILLLNSELLLYTIFAACVLVEFSDPLFPSLDHVVYGSVIKGLTILDLLVLVLVAAVLLDHHRRREPLRGVGPMSIPLALLAVALVGGTVTGHYAGASTREIYEPVVKVSHVVILPLLVVNMTQTRGTWRRFLELTVVLIAIKSVLGIYIAHTNGLTSGEVEGHSLSYLEPTANWLTMTYVLAVVAALVQKIRLPAWAYAIAPFALLCVLLSYRRSFWIGTVLGLAIVVLLGSGRKGRRVVVPALAILVVVTIGLLSSAGGTSTESSNPVLQRVSSLNPTKITTNVEDRYRIDERRNVLANLKQKPLLGLGIAVPWTAPHPMSTEHPGGRLYTHMIVLWYWMNLGILGLISYLALMFATLWMSFTVWRWHPYAYVRLFGLAMLGGIAGLMAAETTGSFIGVDVRFSIALPVVLGFLALAWHEAASRRRADAGAQPRGPAGPARVVAVGVSGAAGRRALPG